eukprot:967337-Rhodomonas_salina.2
MLGFLSVGKVKTTRCYTLCSKPHAQHPEAWRRISATIANEVQGIVNRGGGVAFEGTRENRM